MSSDKFSFLFSFVAAALITTSASNALAQHESRPDFGFELAYGVGTVRNTNFIKTLKMFGYEGEDQSFGSQGRLWGRYSLAIEKSINKNFSLLLQANNLDSGEFVRASGPFEDDTYTWNTWAMGVHARAALPFNNYRSRVYLQAGMGPTITRSTLQTRMTSGGSLHDFDENTWRYHITALAGAEFSPTRIFGMYTQLGYVYAPSLKNLLGERHDSGGFLILFGLRLRTWR